MTQTDRRQEMAGGCRTLHNEELIDIVRVIRYTGHVSRIGEIRIAYKISVENPEGKRPVGRPRRG
jgi:hypothetical protein